MQDDRVKFTAPQQKLIKQAKLIMMCGLPGSGKSSLARQLARDFKGEVISSDKIREEIFLSPHFDQRGDLYYLSIQAKLYDTVYNQARQIIDKNKLAIIDASNMNEYRQRTIKRMRQFLTKDDIVLILVNTPKTVMAKRMKGIKELNDEGESYYSAWKRVYGYFTKYLASGRYSWPDNIDSINMIKVSNE